MALHKIFPQAVFILLLGNTFPNGGNLMTFACAATAPLLQQEDHVTLSDHPVILVVSLDGFRSDYFDKVDTPALNALRAIGVRVPYMEPVFPTNTFPNHQSIVTGLYSESHGIVDNVFYDPELNRTLSGFSDDPGYWNYDPNVLPIWLRNEMAGEGRVSGCFMWPGSASPFGRNNDSFPTYCYPGYDYDGHFPWEERVDTVISWMTNASNPANLVFLYHNEPDSRGHAYGPNSEEVIEEITSTDNRVGYLVDKLKEIGIFDRVNLIMLSDHGMEAVTSSRVSNVSEILDPDLVERVDGGTPVLRLTAKEGLVNQLYLSLLPYWNSHNITVMRRGTMRDPYYYSSSRRISDLVVIADPGYAFDDFHAAVATHNRRWKLAQNVTREYGVHGYANDHPQMRPLFVAHGPNFQQNIDHDPIKNVDVFPLISEILGIEVPANNGSLWRVGGMIRGYVRPSTEDGEGSTEQTTAEATTAAGNMVYCARWILVFTLVVSISNARDFNN